MKRRTKKRLIIAGLSLPLLGAVGAVGGVAGIFWYYGRDLPEIDEQALRDHKPPQVTRVYARDGETLLGEIYTERRTVIGYEDIPSHVELAFLAAEDADFYRHKGMDYSGIVRALIANLRAGEVKQGASTITQQVVKNFLLSPERTFERKVQELLLARKLEQSLSKKEILELYLNEIYFGHGRYGIEEASLYYFGKSVREIDAGQAAMLAALPKSPSKGSPYKDPEWAKKRQVYVLNQMLKHGDISQGEADRFKEAPLDIVADPSTHVEAGLADEFLDVVQAELESRYEPEELSRLGATVITTVDPEVQTKAKKGLDDGLVALDFRRGYGHKIKPARAKNKARAKKKGQGPLKIGSVYPVVITERVEGLPEEGFAAMIGEQPFFVSVPEGSRYDDPEQTYPEQFPVEGITMGRVLSTSDSELPEGWGKAEIGSGPEGIVMVADVESGEVLAMVGGSRYRRGGFNRALRAKRQPGSSFKPFVYGAALESKQFTPASLIADSPEVFEDLDWRPKNYEGDVYRGDIRMRVALTHSVNTVAIKLLLAVGYPAVAEFARRAGIDSALADHPSLALGTSEVVPLDLLQAYMTLARGGNRIEPTFIRSIEVPGEELWKPEREGEQVLAADVVFVLVSMMRSVVEEGTARKAKSLGIQLAGKTGTSSDFKDAWFAGFSTQHVAVSWVGFDLPKTMKRETGGRAALPIWMTAMAAAAKGAEPTEFAVPDSVVIRAIETTSGLLAPSDPDVLAGGQPGIDPVLEAPPLETMEEYFLAGTEPSDEYNVAAIGAEDALLGLYDEEAPQVAGLDPVETPAGEGADDPGGSPTPDPADASDPPDPSDSPPEEPPDGDFALGGSGEDDDDAVDPDPGDEPQFGSLPGIDD